MYAMSYQYHLRSADVIVTEGHTAGVAAARSSAPDQQARGQSDVQVSSMSSEDISVVDEIAASGAPNSIQSEQVVGTTATLSHQLSHTVLHKKSLPHPYPDK